MMEDDADLNLLVSQGYRIHSLLKINAYIHSEDYVLVLYEKEEYPRV
jgi:hypothetical protein